MKIAFLAPRYHTNQKNIVNYLLQQNYSVSFYSTNIGAVEDHYDIKPKLIEVSTFSRLIKKYFQSGDEFYEYNSALPSFKSLKEFIQCKYDLIIIRNPNRMMAIVFSLISKFLGIKIVFYSQMDLHRKPNKKKDMLIKILLDYFKADWITPCLGDIKYEKIDSRITYLPFSSEAHHYNKKWFNNDKINIIDIGKYEDRKSHHILIKALQLLQQDYNFTLTIIGDASLPFRKKYYESLSHLIEQSNFEINCIQNISLGEVYEYYKKSDLFILPSINEPASVSNLEAISFGLPVITSDTNKTSCYTISGVNGLIFKSNDVKDLAFKIRNIIFNKDNLIKMGQNSYKVLETNHLPEKIYGNFFNKIINELKQKETLKIRINNENNK